MQDQGARKEVMDLLERVEADLRFRRRAAIHNILLLNEGREPTEEEIQAHEALWDKWLEKHTAGVTDH